MIAITTMFLCICVIIFTVLSMRVIKGRRSQRIIVGDGNNESFKYLMRGHANFAEYTPTGILCLAAAELAGAHPILLIISGTLLIVGRILHGYYFHKNNRLLKVRVRGMQCTFYAIWSAAASALGYTLLSLF
jgi:uncharacterized membrane protein YecN with MAPEG domain